MVKFDLLAWSRYSDLKIEIDFKRGASPTMPVWSKNGFVNLTRVWQTDVMKTKTPSYHRHRFPVWSKIHPALRYLKNSSFSMGRNL